MRMRRRENIRGKYSRFYRKYQNLKSRVEQMVQDGSFQALQLYRQNELLRKLRQRFQRVRRLQSRFGMAAAGFALAFALTMQNVQAGKSFVNRMAGNNPLANGSPFAEVYGGSWSDPTFVDIDGDRDQDLILGELSGEILFYENIGDKDSPVFKMRKREDNPLKNVGESNTTPEFADLDGDGDYDCVFGDYRGRIQYWENTGTRRKPAFTNRTGGGDDPFGGADVGTYSSIALVDIDGDGDTDCFVGEYYGTIKFYENTGTNKVPTFTEQVGGDNPFNGVDLGDYTSPVFVDIDNDGDFDCFIGEMDDLTTYYYENTGDANNPTFVQRAGGQNPLSAFTMGNNIAPGFTDLDNDGDFDAVIGSYEGTLYYLENSGTAETANFQDKSQIVEYQASPALVDIDNDGDLDLFVGGMDGQVRYFANTGDNENPDFTEQTGVSNPFNGVDVGGRSVPSFVDIDGDNDFDCFIGENDGTVNFFKNIGNVTTPNYVDRTGLADDPLNGEDVGTKSNPSFVDIDGDNDFDCFLGATTGSVLYYENTGNVNIPTFTARVGGSNPLNGFDVGMNSVPRFFDLDDDNDIDCFIGANNGGIYFYDNLGDVNTPNFSDENDSDNPFYGIDLGYDSKPEFGDLDGDGENEAFVGNRQGVLYYYEQGNELAYGSIFQQLATDTDDGVGGNLTNFTRKPRIFGQYYDPIKDPEEDRQKKATATVKTKCTTTTTPTTIGCEWKRKLKLYTSRDFTQAYRDGRTAEDFITDNPIFPMYIDMRLTTKEGGNDIAQGIGDFVLAPPIIDEVTEDDGVTPATTATNDEQIILHGSNFGKNRPRVWIEYQDANGRIKKKSLKIIRPYEYADYNGRAGKTPMDINEGDSKLTIQFPARWPNGWVHGAGGTHNIVLDNGVGITTIDFETN